VCLGGSSARADSAGPKVMTNEAMAFPAFVRAKTLA
jgi:hypothetical protein